MIILRAAVCLGLIVGFYFIGFGLIVGLGWLSVWMWLSLPGDLAQGVSYLMFATAAGLCLPAWQIFRAAPEQPDGVRVTEQQAPELWATVRELADLGATRPPDEIRLIGVVNAGVSEDARLLGLLPGRRYLSIGVPLLSAMSVTQVRAVLAHELGHYSEGHTRLYALTYGGMQAIAQTVRQVGPASVTGRIMGAYGQLYFLVALAVMRRAELAADRAAVRVAGAEATVQTLYDLHRLHAAWPEILDTFAGWVRKTGYTPAEFLAWLGWLVERDGPELRRPMARVGQASPWDTHPPLATRVALIGQLRGPDAVADPRPGAVLVADGAAVDQALRTAEIDEHLERAMQETAKREAAPLYRAAALVAGTPPRGLGCVLDVLAVGRAAALAKALALPAYQPNGPDRQVRLADRVLAAVGATAVNSGVARWRHSWSEPMRLVSEDGEPLTLWPLVVQACADPVAVGQLRAVLAELGIDHATTDHAAASRPATGHPDGRAAGRPVTTRQALDPGLAVRPLPGFTDPETSTPLLPDELFVFAHQPTGRRRVQWDVFQAGLAAAALAELRLRGRVVIAPTAEATIRVNDSTPTGNRFLDSVLARVVAGGRHPAYRWLQLLGPDVTEAVCRRVDLLGLCDVRRGSDRYRPTVTGIGVIRRAREGLLRALRTGDRDGRDVVLGSLLWGVELVAPSLGWTSCWAWPWLGHIAARDRLAMAIRNVIGLYLPATSGGPTGGGG